ncbi:MAG: hypothetical protein MJE68_27295 [Proteobacteria bacterium]|nr:hypothetical protein [Pseudomonadota bacterium]
MARPLPNAKLYPLVKVNPRAKNNKHGRKALQIIIDAPGITFENYCELYAEINKKDKGDVWRHLRWDIGEGRVQVIGGRVPEKYPE